MLNVHLIIWIQGVASGKDAQSQMHMQEVMIGRNKVGLVLRDVVDQLRVWLVSPPGLCYWLQEIIKSDLDFPFPFPFMFHPRPQMDVGQDKLYSFPVWWGNAHMHPPSCEVVMEVKIMNSDFIN